MNEMSANRLRKAVIFLPPGGSDWVMVADTVLTASCPMPDELEVHLVVRETTP